MRILFANHTGAVSGAEHALLRLLHHLREAHEITVACPGDSPLAQALGAAGITRLSLPVFETSFRPHPVRTPAGIMRLSAGGIMLARHAAQQDTQVLYANTTRAGLMGALARRLGGPPLVVRLHDHLPASAAGRAVRSFTATHASSVLAVSNYTAARFNEGLQSPVATTVPNGIDLNRFDPARVAPAALRAELGLPADALLLGQVAQITPWKGQAEAIRIVAVLRYSGVDAHLVLVGEIAFAGKGVRYDNPSYLKGLHTLVEQLGMGHAVHFLGHRQDVPAVLRAIDLSLLPSDEEPFALAVVESLAMDTPAFVSDQGGAAEIVEDGLSGRVLPRGRVDLWAAAIRELLEDPAALEQMRSRTRSRATRFQELEHAHAIEAHLQQVAASRPPLPLRPGGHGGTSIMIPGND